VLLVLVARSLPRIHEGESGEAEPRGAFSRYILSDLPHRADVSLSIFLEKIMRRLRIILLRFDNFLTEHLRRISDQNKEKPKIDFKDIENTAELGEKSELEAK